MKFNFESERELLERLETLRLTGDLGGKGQLLLQQQQQKLV